jgi:hypothetical protein
MGEGNEGLSTRCSRKLNSIAGGSVSFFNELDTDNEPCSWISVSFFNEIDIERELCSWVSVFVFNELDMKRELCSWVFVSFFNDLDTESEFLLGSFSFYTILKQRIKLCSG